MFFIRSAPTQGSSKEIDLVARKMPRPPRDLFAIAGPCTCAMCQEAPKPPLRSIVLVPQAAIDMWLLELEVMPRRKRTSWKGKLLDDRGVASRLRFDPTGECGSFFQEYNTYQSQWLPVYPYESMRDSFESFALATPLAECTDRIMRQGDVEGLRELYTARTSGKSRRRRFIPVPTAAGEPTRG